ncbi:MAG TPA: hypothetical protein VFB84_13370 [Micromonosporaceae bacterium]|nr:hypothetical protein [Micromonosporaceae bacterium]
MDLGFLVNIATIFSVVATFGFGVREVLRERSALREPRRPTPIADLRSPGLPLQLRDARVTSGTDAAGQREFVLAVTFAPAAAPQAEPGAGGPRMPDGVTVVEVTGQPFDVQSDLLSAQQTAGDADAGFYRAARRRGWPAGAVVESYKWGRFTAGTAARALWLLFLPFQLANVAMWLRPPAGRLARRGVQTLCRLFALAMTASFVMAVAGAALDLVAWQCTVPNSRCTAGRAWLAPFIDGPFDTPGRRLAVLALVPIAAIAVLWRLARRTWWTYEAYPAPEFASAGDGLAAPTFWHGRAVVRRLRVLHVATAFATLDALVLVPLLGHDRSVAGPVLLGTALATVLASTVGVCLPAVVRREPRGAGDWLTAAVLTTALVTTVLTLWHAFWLPADWATGPGLPGYGKAAIGLFTAQLVLLGVLTVTIFVQRRAQPPDRSFGYGAPVVGLLALGAAAAFAGGLLYRVADFLSRAPGAPETGLAVVPVEGPQPATAYQWSGLGFVILLAAGALAMLGLYRTRRALVRPARTKTDSLFPGQRPLNPQRAVDVDEAVASARLTDRIVPLLGWAGLPIGLLAVAGTGLALAGTRPAMAGGTTVARLLDTVTNIGTYLIGVAALGLVVLGLLAYRYDRVRRFIGVVWDLGTFWPRTCHPLGPPCYAERIVPELMVRLAQLAARPRAGAVLVGHGQGAVLATATLLQLHPAVRERVGLVTTGPPLRRLYARLFPAYVNDTVLAELATCLSRPGAPPRWVNLWRATDPTGGPVTPKPGRAPVPAVLAPVDREVRDPVSLDFAPELGGYPPIHGHLAYEEAPGFAAAVLQVARAVAGTATDIDQSGANREPSGWPGPAAGG